MGYRDVATISCNSSTGAYAHLTPLRPTSRQSFAGEIYIDRWIGLRHPFERIVEEQGALGVTERVKNVGNQFHTKPPFGMSSSAPSSI
jgi:hypothetical protein